MYLRRTFWWDVLEDLLIAGAAPGELAVEIDGIPYHWPLAGQRDRFRAYDELYGILSRMTPLEQNDLVDEIVRTLGGPSEDRDNRAALGVQELRSLETEGLPAVGGYPHHSTNVAAVLRHDRGNGRDLCDRSRRSFG